MNIKYHLTDVGPRARAQIWCKWADLTEDDGVYTFDDDTLNASLGFGSEIIVVDQPAMILFWDNDAENEGASAGAYIWSGTAPTE